MAKSVSIPLYGLFALVVITAFSSCYRGDAYEKYQSIPNMEWEQDSLVTFDVHIEDNKTPYDIDVFVRHGSSYTYSNFYFLLQQQGAGLKDSAQRFEVKLAELDGRWLGQSAGNLYEVAIPVKEKFVFPDTGTYRFVIEQNMRENPIAHISDIGLKVKHAK